MLFDWSFPPLLLVLHNLHGHIVDVRIFCSSVLVYRSIMMNFNRYILWSVFFPSFASFMQFSWSLRVMHGCTYVLQVLQDSEWWWRQWWWLQQAMVATRACTSERVSRANFALLVLPRGSAGWSASSLVPASPPCPGGCLGIVSRRRNFPRAFF